MNVDIAPLKLAKWLQVTLNQRKRATIKLSDDFGTESAAVAEGNSEIADISNVINQCIKAAAAAPLKPSK